MDACEDQECDYACILEAGEESADKFMALVECGDQHGCFDGGGGGEPVCGNGVCEQGENGFNCDEDCKPPPGSCGNQECEDGETPQNCPTDCESDEPPGGETIACLQDKCGPSFFGCIEDEACVGIIECMQQCETDECEQGCFANVSQSSFGKFMDLVECGDAEGCFGGPGGGDGTDPPEDPTLQCIEEQCGNEYGDCFNDEGCTAILECMAQCAPDDDGCNDNCVWTAGGWGGNNTFWALADCAETEGCLDQGNDGGGDGGGGGDGADWECGDGQCDPGENFFCPQDC